MALRTRRAESVTKASLLHHQIGRNARRYQWSALISMDDPTEKRGTFYILFIIRNVAHCDAFRKLKPSTFTTSYLKKYYRKAERNGYVTKIYMWMLTPVAFDTCKRRRFSLTCWQKLAHSKKKIITIAHSKSWCTQCEQLMSIFSVLRHCRSPNPATPLLNRPFCSEIQSELEPHCNYWSVPVLQWKSAIWLWVLNLEGLISVQNVSTHTYTAR